MSRATGNAGFPTPKIYVLYHGGCTDGTGAKYAAWKKFKNAAEYIAVNYGQEPPEMQPESQIFIVDFSYPKDVLERLQSDHTSVVVLDHHKTAEEALRGLKGCHFDMHKSGAVLAWEYFHPDVPVPELLLDIQDRDLWLWKRPNSAYVHAGLGLLEGKMAAWDNIVYSELVANGKLLVAKQEQAVKGYIKNKIKIISFLGYKVGITNVSDYASEIGNAICINKEFEVDFSICYGITPDNTVLLSLRSDPNKDMDVSEVAKKFGGGGHKNASGCRVSLQTLSDILNEKMT